MLNGQPWKPQGNSGTGNLSIDFDPGLNNGIMGIATYRTISATDKTQFGLGIVDSLNFKNAPFTLLIRKKSLGGLSFSTKSYCDILVSSNDKCNAAVSSPSGGTPRRGGN